MEKLKSMVADIKAGWEKTDRKKRVTVLSIVAAIAIGFLIMTYYIQKTEYKVLFSELEEADAGAIVEDLEAKGMDYKLEDNGATILIDKDLVDHYRIELAVDGPMPSTSTGFEIFDSASMMTTDEDRAIMYERAISGELERAISSLEQIKASKVLLNIPENSVFQNPNFTKEASASVILEMNNNQMPNQATVQGIAALVSGAVENLPQENVEIVDTTGRLLSTSIGDSYNLNTDIVSEHQRIKSMVERNLEEKVIKILAPVYGLESVQVSVNADLNFDAIEREIVEYEDEGSIRSQTESVTGNAALAADTQTGNLEDGTSYVTGAGTESDQSTYEHATNYELDTTSTRIVEAPGTIQRLTASVIILDNPRNQEAVRSLVEHAIGANANRDTEFTDSVEIEYFPMNDDPEESPIIGDNAFFDNLQEWLEDYGIYFFIGVILMILILILIRILRNRNYDEDLELEAEFPEVRATAEEPEEVIFDKEIEEKMRKNQIANEKEDAIREQAKENPELAAELIKIWLKEKE